PEPARHQRARGARRRGPCRRHNQETVGRVSMPRRLIFAAFATFAFLSVLPPSASATWSVIAADRSTGRVVIASATCVDRDDQFLMGVQAVVVPGLGVAACQAAVDNTHQNQMLVFRELQRGTEPKVISGMLSADPAFQS